MKKFILIFVISMALPACAQTSEKGYRGSIEAGYAINTGSTLGINWSEINTIHGYQATPNLFVGAGVGFHFMQELKKGEIDGYPHWKRDGKTEIPVFANFKWIILKKKVTPFIDLRQGHDVSNGSGMYASYGAGCRFALKGSQSIFVLASYTTHKLKFEESYMITKADYSYKWAYNEIEEEMTNVSLKVGYEF